MENFSTANIEWFQLTLRKFDNQSYDKWPFSQTRTNFLINCDYNMKIIDFKVCIKFH